jgi:flagellar biosynthesis regulator FlbT
MSRNLINVFFYFSIAKETLIKNKTIFFALKTLLWLTEYERKNLEENQKTKTTKEEANY